MSTNPIEQTAGLPLRTQLSVSEVQAFLEASLDPAPMTFRSLSASNWRCLSPHRI